MDSPAKNADNANGLVLMTLALMSGAIIYASFVALQGLYLEDNNALELKYKTEGVGLDYKAMVKAQSLTEYRMLDGKIRIPLDKAKELVLGNAKGGNPTSLIPAVGASDKPTVPAKFGRPPDGVKMPEPVKPAPPPPPAVPVDGTEAPVEGAEGPGAVTPGAVTTPPAATPAAKAPAAKAPAAKAPAAKAPAAKAPAAKAPAAKAPAAKVPAGGNATP